MFVSLGWLSCSAAETDLEDVEGVIDPVKLMVLCITGVKEMQTML